MSLEDLQPLRTERLALRPAQETDAEDLFAVYGDPRVVRYLPHPAWQTEVEARAWLGRMRGLEATGSGRLFVMAPHGAGKVIGTVLLFRHEPSSGRAEIAYVLGRAHWGHGLIREALRPLCASAFERARLRRIEAEARPENVASNRLLAAIGFTLEGRLRQRWPGNGAGHDVHHWGLLAGELR